ncbi:MAG: hypothetical protein IJ760_04250 [Bacteroidales bacterium]|nr:hypothetical protein [Bacteroidales bacterium]
MRAAVVAMAAMLMAGSAAADDGRPPSRGLAITGDAGAWLADNNTADFYSGKPGNSNTIDLVLHSNLYGRQIWQTLVDQGLISPSAIGSHEALRVAEYPSMRYRVGLHYAVGLHYVYASGFGWLLRADMARLHAEGAFNLEATAGGGVLGSRQYVRCGIAGREDRVCIDFALTQRVPLGGRLDLEIDLGASLVNTKVRENIIEAGGGTWSILDVWGGHSPDYNAGSYDYINQGGIGYGVFVSLLVGYELPVLGTMKAGYTCSQARTVLEGHTAWGWQHMLGIRLELNNFSFTE